LSTIWPTEIVAMSIQPEAREPTLPSIPPIVVKGPMGVPARAPVQDDE